MGMENGMTKREQARADHEHECRDCGSGVPCNGPEDCFEFDGSCENCHRLERKQAWETRATLHVAEGK